jgi:Ubiquitin carboxyl-terminal hydrolase, family 1
MFVCCWTRGRLPGWPQAAANEGQTKPPALDEVVALHFAALVERDGQLWELDGRKSGPVSHGPTSKDTLLQVSLSNHSSACCAQGCLEQLRQMAPR